MPDYPEEIQDPFERQILEDRIIPVFVKLQLAAEGESRLSTLVASMMVGKNAISQVLEANPSLEENENFMLVCQFFDTAYANFYDLTIETYKKQIRESN